ncbi:DNA methyltransferase [Ruegeria sp. THAF33]|uniref:site-specific DNA-methyltransferase n=1 Tax=Ruegeria sp. THAF33 TaxID=2587853 RepID=UPI0012AAA9E8|nr:DNA methyltransferase [Ruegeria sp. THAF33]QFT71767.1 Modification methylase DpnIIB [Ruegeria sp. THAF33]
MPTQSNTTPETRRNRPVWMTGKVDQTPISDLKPYPTNVRSHSEKSLGRLADSISEFGFVVPVVIDNDNTVITGHGRIEAAKRLKLSTIPTICADHLTPAQVKAYRIADNRLAELSDWNEDALRIELGELMDLSLAGDLDFSLDITGFEIPEIDIIIGSVDDDTTEAAETVEDPDPAKPVVTRPGDLWQLRDHLILCGDSLRAQSYESLLNGEPCRMIFTDPPYNVPVNGHVRSGNGGDHREFAMASGEMSDAEFRTFLSDVMVRLIEQLVDGGIAMVCMDWRHIEELIAAGKACGFKLINLCIWNKTNGGMGSLYRSKHEMVAIFKKAGAPHINNVELGKHGRNRTNVWEYAGVNTFGAGREADLADHPTVKPTALVVDALMDVSHRGDIVLDAFGGSGATLLAAEKTGRCARLVELDPAYVDVAIRRWQEMTGQQTVHAASGETWDQRAAAVAEVKEVDHV